MASAEGPKVEFPVVDSSIVAPAREASKTMESAPLPVWPRSVVPSALAAATASRKVTRPLPEVVLSAAELTVSVAALAAITPAKVITVHRKRVNRRTAVIAASLFGLSDGRGRGSGESIKKGRQIDF